MPEIHEQGDSDADNMIQSLTPSTQRIPVRNPVVVEPDADTSAVHEREASWTEVHGSVEVAVHVGRRCGMKAIHGSNKTREEEREAPWKDERGGTEREEDPNEEKTLESTAMQEKKHGRSTMEAKLSALLPKVETKLVMTTGTTA